MIIKEKISKEKFEELADGASMVKMAVDIKKEIMSLGCELHMDCADELMQNGSENKNVWGANIYPKKMALDFSAVFNIRPGMGNRSMEIQDVEITRNVEEVIKKLLPI